MRALPTGERPVVAPERSGSVLEMSEGTVRNYLPEAIGARGSEVQSRGFAATLMRQPGVVTTVELHHVPEAAVA